MVGCAVPVVAHSAAVVVRTAAGVGDVVIAVAGVVVLGGILVVPVLPCGGALVSTSYGQLAVQVNALQLNALPATPQAALLAALLVVLPNVTPEAQWGAPSAMQQGDGALGGQNGR